jgi:uncharacterized membrane protein (DUF4010 family)
MHMYDMLPDELIWRLSVALAIGLLIGLERGWKAREAAEGERAAGVRTLALAGLLGGVWGAVAAPYGGYGVIALALAFMAFVAVIALFRLREIAAEHIYGATTVVAAMLSFALGAFSVIGEPLPAIAGGVATAALLASKTALHAWLQRLSWPELRSGLVLLVMSFILLPALPNHPIDPWGAINPFALWLMTVLIATISFVGYVAVKAVGYRRGLAVAGLAGGLASSTATTAAMARLAPERADQVGALAGGAVLANAVMALRVLAILGLINLDLALRLAAPLTGLALVYLLAGATLVRSERAGGDHADQAPLIDNPLDLAMVLKFGLFLALVMALSRIASHFAGPAGVYAIAMLSGMADVDAIALAMGRQGAAEIGLQAAGIAVLLAIASNTLVKTVLGWTLGGRALGARLAIASTLALIGAGLIILTSHGLLG